MLNGTVAHVAKKSFIYSYMVSQPFAVYVDAYPILQSKLLLEQDQLQFGEHGETVRILQEKLANLAYYEDEIDGELGIYTEHALKKIQKEYNINITGKADAETLLAIIQAEKERNLKQLEHFTETVYPGMHSNDLKIVQEALHYLGYYNGNMDGIYGPLTERALKLAEEEHGIELTKEITRESLEQLYESDQQELATIAETKEKKAEAKQEENEVNNKDESEGSNADVKQVEVSGGTVNTGIVEVAQSFIGTPYVWGGQSPGGFDCSGFIQYVYQTQSITVPRTTSDLWNFSQSVDSPSIGDLVFFSTYQPGPSHVGIYLGNGNFIHAGESRGVEISELSQSYWQEKYLGAKRVNQ